MIWVMHRPLRILVLFFLCACGGPRASAQPGSPPKTGTVGPPSLVVLITVDQLRGDYLDRFGDQLNGGLARVARGGAWFSNAHQDHAITETAPGHASLLSGRFPRSTGIMANRIGVYDDAAPVIGATGPAGASPHRFQGTTLVDWLRLRDSRSRILSVSMKDRGAILPVGRSRAEVYWYSYDGRFTTSKYYRDTLPEWVQRFNARRLPQSFAGKSWTPLLPDSAYKEADSVSVEAGGVNFLFPHRIPDDSTRAASEVTASPWMDEITLALALDGLRALSLGEGARTDVLAISLSATDLIGHTYGPDSKEIHDNILRLDRALGVFLDSLLKLREPSRVAIVLTGDHGVATIPELAARSVKPTPARVNASALAMKLRGLVAAAGLDSSLVYMEHHILLADRNALKSRRASLDSVLAAFTVQVRAVPGVSRVDRFQDLLRGDTINGPIARRWAHQFPAQSNVELVITLTPFSIFGSGVATHGSPHDYDSHVPLIFYGPWFKPGRYTEFVRTVDLAPTLAEITGVRPSEKVDGVVLRRALK
jgi:predicted AlkP superfamily pyrophosphatase or phosphodiesterase